MVSKPSEKSAKQPAKQAGASNALLTSLKKHLKASILPGDTSLDGPTLTEAAEFILEAAHQRDSQRSSLRLESAAGERRKMRIAIINDDMPFLVDSIAATIAAQSLSIDRLVHPVLCAERNDAGELIRLSDAKSDGLPLESLIYIETPRVDARQRRELEQALRVTLGDVRAAVTDWPKMQALMASDMAAIGDDESQTLMTWLNNGMLTQLGHVKRDRGGKQSEAKGICRKSTRDILAEASIERAFDWFDDCDARNDRHDLLVIKANRLSHVHRRIPLDLFIVGLRDTKSGKVQTLSIHAGIWTSAAMATPPTEVPVLRADLEAISQKLGFSKGGHASKALIHAFTALPNDLLIGFTQDSIARLATTMMSLVDRPRPRLALITSRLDRHIYAFVWQPRDTVSTQVRLQIEDMFTAHEGTAVLDWTLEVEGGTLAMLQFVIDIREAKQLPDEAALELQFQDMLRGWGEAVEKQLSETMDPSRAAALASRYADALPMNYRGRYDATEAALDITCLRSLSSDLENRRGARLYRIGKDPVHRLRLKIYQHEGALPLSDAVPALENFGFRVIKEIPVTLDEGKLGTIHEFTVDLPESASAAKLLERTHAIEPAIAEVLNGGAEDDPFNRLVVSTGLAAQETEWLRAIYRYLRQTGMGFTIYTVVDALGRAPDVTRAMIDLFVAKHNPGFSSSRDEAVSGAVAAFNRGLAKVSAINDDRLLRLYRAVIDAVLRTNAFAPAAAEALAFKIDSALVPNLPKPVPWREIFVYSRRVEGIHLRSGAIARGGLRWSDRRDDFRTEILGLMKAQRVKNAVIVPTGAKGGFYPKQLPSPATDREGWAAEGQDSYEVFIRTLLSVTDNIVDGKVIHPEKVAIHDGEDPYFVVAADKGTARFSDVANGIAESRDFWLDDAFASGGSNGYDHKAMGITARGAWVSVQRHFLEMGVDVQKDSIRVAGCGDMSGDVFGNGMLLSNAIKLVAAFDHRHIFIDPDPDPAASWKERKRLYDLPRSSWEEYNSDLISKGGGVYSRDMKRIKLSKKAREMLGIEEKEIEPDALVSAILKAELDLIWFGGIGTYIKAEHESHLAVGDPANDALRIDAVELRTKVIGEGANLGITQAGRIAFSMNGGRINTDFIDNSAGVDCSDNEVNIKIALAAATREGVLTEKKRNNLLAKMTDEVADIVLEDNRLQALALSVAEAAGPEATASYIRLIEQLEEIGDLDRRTEGLAQSDAFTRRAADGKGLTRPELAVLLSSAKLALQDAIEASGLPDDPMLESSLIALFPEPMRKSFTPQIQGHRLRRELVATDLSNRIVNRLGLVHAFELAEEEGVGLSDVAAAFVVVERMFDLGTLWEELDTAKMSEATRLTLFDRAAAAVGNLMSDVLRTAAGQVQAGELVETLQSRIGILKEAHSELLSSETRERSEQLRRHFVDQGCPDALALKVANLFDYDGSIGLAQLSLTTDLDPKQITHAFTDIGGRIGLDWAQGTAAHMSPSDIWERLLVDGLARDFQHMRLEFLRRLLRRKGGKDDPQGAIADWAARNKNAVAQFRAMITRAQARPPIAPAVLAQIASQARNLLER